MCYITNVKELRDCAKSNVEQLEKCKQKFKKRFSSFPNKSLQYNINKRKTWKNFDKSKKEIQLRFCQTIHQQIIVITNKKCVTEHNTTMRTRNRNIVKRKKNITTRQRTKYKY